MPELSQLGYFDDRDEYQIDKTIVWIHVPDRGIRSDWIEQGKAAFWEAWKHCGEILMIAESYSRKANPEFWTAYPPDSGKKSPLQIRGLSVRPDSKLLMWDIWDNYELADSCGLKPPADDDDFHICIDLKSTFSKPWEAIPY